MEQNYIKSADEMVEIVHDKLDNFDSIIKYIGRLIVSKANEGEQEVYINFEEYSVPIRRCFTRYLGDLIKILIEQGYKCEIEAHYLHIHW